MFIEFLDLLSNISGHIVSGVRFGICSQKQLFSDI